MSRQEEERIAGANEQENASSAEIQSAKMIEIDVLLPFIQGAKKKKKINDHFHRLQ